ncbi:hypothetical protein WA026_014032 [Henosepilachna vigintioctopunctata]|uniref:C2H2-type domain-containing protein n=1 Tax=Henosepilachna vigintioctopunctata TaxID=420089 RepID=A0AAW1TYI6_9CUCU
MENDEDYYSSSESTTYSEFVDDPPTKRHKCSYEGCNKAFFRPSKLADHLRRHSNERPFICHYENCEKTYHKNEALKKHQKRVHLKEVESTLCPVEGCLQEIQKANLKKHILRKHNNFRRYNFQCIECQKGFCKETHLNNHFTEHVPIYTCNMCQKVFQQGHRFRTHVKSHKKYECICKEVFYLRTKLTSHEKTCELLKRQCQICGVTFSTSFNYLQHTSHCHIDKSCIEKFRCNFEGCTKEYNYKKNLNMHQRKSHSKKSESEDNKWTCVTCGKSFKTREYMRKHSKKLHSNPKPKEIKLRKPRFDKGVPKTPMITMLTGFQLTKEDNRNRIKMESRDNAKNLEQILNSNNNSTIEDKDNSTVQGKGDSAVHLEEGVVVDNEKCSVVYGGKVSVVHIEYSTVQTEESSNVYSETSHSEEGILNSEGISSILSEDESPV